MRLAIVGAGAVGRSVAELAAEHGHRVTALADSRTATIDADGIDVGAALGAKRDEGRLGDATPSDVVSAEYDVLVEATPTTLGDAEPGFGYLRAALESDRDVVLANKGPVAERYGDVMELARESAGRVRFEATVAGAIPVLGTIQDLGSRNVLAARGVLNGTANFILTRMAAEGLDYEHVLAEAQDLGVAEADPSFDVEGTDAALKCAILANVLSDGSADAGARGGEFSLADVDVTGIDEIPGSALELAARDGRTIRLIGEATPDGARVGPKLVPENSALAVAGTNNIVQLETKHAGQLNISGKGAGGPETATAVLSDVNRLAD